LASFNHCGSILHLQQVTGRGARKLDTQHKDKSRSRDSHYMHTGSRNCNLLVQYTTPCMTNLCEGQFFPVHIYSHFSLLKNILLYKPSFYNTFA